MKYHVIRCIKCTEIYVSSGIKEFNCRFCGRITSRLKTKKSGCFYQTFENPLEAKDFCIHLKTHFPRRSRIPVQ